MSRFIAPQPTGWRGFGDVTLSEAQADMAATAQVLALTPTPTDDPAAATGD